MASSSTRSAAAFTKSSASIRAASDRDKNRIPQQTTNARDPDGTGGGDVRLDTQGNATIRRRIPEFTLLLGPLPLHTNQSGGAVSNDAAAVPVFTDEDATLVRNTIETLITTYLLTEQPWAQVREDDGNILPAGSVTSVGLTNSVDSRLVPEEEEDSVAVTMQGLIYFASGLGGGGGATPNMAGGGTGVLDIPEEADILQTLEDVILTPAVVLAALQQEFPAVQSVTIGDNTLTLPATIVEPEPKPTPSTGVAPAPSAAAAVAVTLPSLAPSTVASIGTETTSASAVINEKGNPAKTTNMAGLVGGIAAGVAVVIVVLGMWMVRTKRQQKKSPRRRGSGNDDIQYLVEVGSKDGLKLAYDWKSNSNQSLPSPTGTDATVPASPHEFVDRTIRNTDDDDDNDNDNDDDDTRNKGSEDMERGRSVVLTSPSEVSKTREAGTTAEESHTHTTTSGLGESALNYLSSFFAKSTTPALAHDDVHSVSAIAIDRGSTGEMQGAENLKSVVSDLDGTSVSMSVPTLPSTTDVLTLESFQEQHQTLQRESRGMNGGIGGVQDRKEMLESSFGKISRALSLSGKEYFNADSNTNTDTNTALNLSSPPPLERSHSDVSSNLSYSSSSMSSIGDQHRREGKGRKDRSHGHKKRKNRKKGVVRTTALKREGSPGGTMMPNPYFGGNRSPDRDRRTTYPGLLAPTDTTAAALAGPSRRRATATTSDPGSSNSGLGMRVPKLSSPLAWLNNSVGSTGGGGRSSLSSSSSKKIRSFSNSSKRASRTSSNSRTGSQPNVIRSRSSGSGSRRSKAVEEAFKDEGYSGDEENNLETDGSTTFGAPSSDGWDSTDVLADLGANDDPDDERNHMRLFRKNGNHTGSNQLPSLLNTTTTSSSYRKKNNGGSSSFRKSSSSTKELQKLNALLPPKHPSWNQNDDTDSLYSEESNVLKFVSSVDMSVDMEI